MFIEDQKWEAYNIVDVNSFIIFFKDQSFKKNKINNYVNDRSSYTNRPHYYVNNILT